MYIFKVALEFVNHFSDKVADYMVFARNFKKIS